MDLVSDPAPGSEEEKQSLASAREVVDKLEQAYRDSGGSGEACQDAGVEVKGADPPSNGMLYITMVLIIRTWIVFFSSLYLFPHYFSRSLRCARPTAEVLSPLHLTRIRVLLVPDVPATW